MNVGDCGLVDLKIDPYGEINLRIKNDLPFKVCFSRSLFFFPLCFSDTSEIFVFCTFCALSSVWFMMVRFLPLFYCRYENRIDRGESWNIPQSSNVPQILRIFGRFASQISHNKFSDKLAYLKIYF